MRFGTSVVGLMIGYLLVCPALVLADADGDAGAKSFAQGTELVKKADFNAALEAYAAAARADGDNDGYRQQYMLVRRVIKMRKVVTKEKNPQKWLHSAVALRNFYYQYGLYKELLTLAKQMNERQPTVGSATILADAHLSLGQNAEAEKVIAGLDKDKLTEQAKALLCIALARQKKTDQAKAALEGIKIPKMSSPRFLVDVARMKALCGDTAGAGATLTRAFESTTPSALPSMKAYAKKIPDFAAIAKTDQFAAAMKTKSKVTESDCSGGSSCGSCPSRGSCGSSAGSGCAQAANKQRHN